jgi:hypothetical protein
VADWQITDLIEHFCTVNGASREEFDTHAANAWNEWKRLSGLRWRVDLRPYSDQLVEADPARDIKALRPGSGRPWDDPADAQRRSEFLYLLTKLSTRYGYWIGSTAGSEAPPLYVLEPGTKAGGYSISRTVLPDSGYDAPAPHDLSWSDDPLTGRTRSKRRPSK